MKIVSLDIYNESRQMYEALGELYSQKDKFRGEDFDVIETIFTGVANTNLKVLDLGCGNGNFIKYILDNHYETIDKIVGVDFSNSMINSTKKRLTPSEINKVELVCMDINDYLYSSTSHFDMVLVANNVLGNILPSNNDFLSDYRVDILKRIKHIVAPAGHVFISVYNKEKLYDNGKRYDDHDWSLHEKLTENDFIVAVKIYNKVYYYFTHWFQEKDIYYLAAKSNFCLNKLQTRDKRFVATLSHCP